MEFIDNFNKIEEIKKQYNNEYLKQKTDMIPYLEEMSKVVVDSNGINYRFADLVSDYLSKSDFSVFGDARTDNEIMFVSDSSYYGDCFNFINNSNKQIDMINYQTNDKRVTISLKEKRNKVSLIKTIDQLDGSYRQIKSIYEKDGDSYYQKSFSDKLIMNENDLVTYGSEELEYDKDVLTRTYCLVTKDNSKVLSKTNISSIVDKSKYVVENGLFSIINKEKEEKLLKVKELENKLVKKIN